MRIKRGWFPTNQLSHEAREQGFKSVAHYLVLTLVSTNSTVLTFQQDVRPHPRPSQKSHENWDDVNESENIPPHKLKKKQEDIRAFVHRRLHHRRRLQAKGDKELIAVKEELVWSGKDRGEGVSVLDEVLSECGVKARLSNDHTHDDEKDSNGFLGILDQDIAQDDGESVEHRDVSNKIRNVGAVLNRSHRVGEMAYEHVEERTRTAAPASTNSTSGIIAPDEYVWNGLCIRATSIVKGIKHLPNTPPSACIAQLQEVLKDAEALLPESVVISLPSSATTAMSPTPWSCGRLQTHGALRRAVHLLTYLSRLLPTEDVEWRIRRRFESAEPFIDFENSDARAKAIVVRGQFELLATLIKRGLPVEQGVVSCAKGLASIAQSIAELSSAQKIHTQSLLFPVHGGYKDTFDNHGYQTLMKPQLAEILKVQLERATALCPMIGPSAALFLTAEKATLMPALLAAGQEYDAFRLALSLIVTVLKTVMVSTAFDKKSESILVLSDVVQHTITPLIEAAIRREYPSFRFHSSGTSASGNCDDLTSLQPSRSGTEVFEALALCYAFALRCDKIGWPVVEASVTAPYSFMAFWRQANATYRRIATFVLAHTAAHAPETINMHAAGSLFRVWLQSLLPDRYERMAVASYLTRVLATRVPTTSPLFAGVRDCPSLGGALFDMNEGSEHSSRMIILSRVVKSAMTSPHWAAQVHAALVDLDALLVARRKEMTDVTPGQYSQVADTIAQWDWVSCNTVITLLTNIGWSFGDASLHWAKRLVYRLATWVVSSCAYLKARFCLETSELDDNTGNNNQYEEQGVIDRERDPLSTPLTTVVGDVRQHAAHLACASLPDLFAVMVNSIARGDIKSLDNDAEALESLYIIMAGCLEGATGATEPTVVDIVIFEKLGAALSAHPSLCSYVMSTFVRRYLERSSLRHVIHQRAAVNALRLVGSLIEQPAVRTTPGRIKGTLFPLLRPILSVLAPQYVVDTGTTEVPSPAAKAAVYDLLTALVRGMAGHWTLVDDLIPPIVLPTAGSSTIGVSARRNTPSTIALHAFWSAVCRDIVSIVAARLGDAFLSTQLTAAKVFVKEHTWLSRPCQFSKGVADELERSERPATWFWPVNERCISEASNLVLGALGMPRSTNAVDRLYARPGAASIPASLWEVSLGRGPSSLSGTLPDQFRPGDFPWRLANDAIRLLTAFCSTDDTNVHDYHSCNSQESEALQIMVEWAWACYPALYFLVHAMKRAMSPLQAAFDEYRAALLARLGPKPLDVFDEYLAKMGIGIEEVPHAKQEKYSIESSGVLRAATAKPQSTSAAELETPAPAPALGPSSLLKIKEETVPRLLSKTLTQLALSSVGTRAVMVATLVSCHSVPRPDGNQAAMCVVKDWSGPGGTETFAKLAVATPTAAATILKATPGSAIRLEVKVAKVAPQSKGGVLGLGLGLAAAGKSAVEVYSQTVVEVKKERVLEEKSTESKGAASMLPQAVARLIEMGYGEAESRNAVDGELCRTRLSHEDVSDVARLVSAAVETLTRQPG